jgi:nucleotidyltransferase/DNA polymerase involved in DNA repair
MEQRARRIAFVSIPHIFAESEEARRSSKNRPGRPSSGGRPADLPLVIVSGSFAKSVIIDYSNALERSPVKKGAFVKSLEPLRGSIRLLPVDREYVEVIHSMIIARLKNYSPWVESPRAGCYYLDLTGTRRLLGREIETCGRIIRELGETFGLRSRAGIGGTILVARMAARVAGRQGAYDVCPSSEGLFLTPLGIELIPELSLRVKRELLGAYNIRRIGDLQPFSKEELTGMFGREGNVLYTCARNLARNRLVERETDQVLERELDVSSENNDDERLRRQFFSMVTELCVRMREERLLPGAFSLKVVYQDNYRVSCGGRLANTSSFEKSLYEELVVHLNKALARRTCVKKLLLSFSRLSPHARQLELFQDNLREERLADAFDDLQRRVGKGSLSWGFPSMEDRSP